MPRPRTFPAPPGYRVCTHCQQAKPDDHEHFYWSVTGKWLASWCRECVKANKRGSAHQQVMRKLQTTFASWRTLQ